MTTNPSTCALSPTGELVLKITSYSGSGVPTSWQDEAENPLDQRLNLIIAGFVVSAAFAKHQREVREQEAHRHWEAQQAERRREEKRKAELARKKELRDCALAWQQAAAVRNYVAAVRQAHEAGTLDTSPEKLENGHSGRMPEKSIPSNPEPHYL